LHDASRPLQGKIISGLGVTTGFWDRMWGAAWTVVAEPPITVLREISWGGSSKARPRRPEPFSLNNFLFPQTLIKPVNRPTVTATNPIQL